MSRRTREILARVRQTDKPKQPWQKKIENTNNFGDEPKTPKELFRDMSPAEKEEYLARKKTASNLSNKWNPDEKLKKETTSQGYNREIRSIGGYQNKKSPHTPIGERAI